MATIRLPRLRARWSASSSELRSSVSRPSAESPGSGRGATLSSMLNCASSVWKSGSSMASRTSALAKAGSKASSMRLSSIYSPVSGRSASKCASASIRSKTSRFWWTFSR